MAEIDAYENNEREISDNRMNIGLGILSLLAVCSAITDGFGSVDIIMKLLELGEDVRPYLSWGIMIFCIIVGFIAVRSIIPLIGRERKLKKELADRKERKTNSGKE